MIISEEYGPQFDPSDGTIGELQLVKRWGIVFKGTDRLFTARQGRYLVATEEDAQTRIDQIVAANSPDRIGGDLEPARFWCYPNHFDPVAIIEP